MESLVPPSRLWEMALASTADDTVLDKGKTQDFPVVPDAPNPQERRDPVFGTWPSARQTPGA